MPLFSRNIIILAIAVIFISGAYSFYYHDRPRVDAKAYDAIAQNLAEGYGYVELRENASHPEEDDAIVRVGPGYQFFLAGIYKLFGHHIWIVWILQALFRGVSVLLVYLIGRFFFDNAFSEHFQKSENASLVAAGLFGFSPDLIVINGLLLTETIFIFLLLVALYGTLRLFEVNISSAIIFLTGAVWGLTILTRPMALLPFLLSFGIMFWKKEWKRALIFLVPAILLVAPWSIFMSVRYDTFILTTTAGELDLWVGNNPDATGGFVKTPEIQEIRNSLHSVEFGEISRKKYFEFLTKHPLQFIELQWRKAAIFFSLIRPTGFWIHLIAYPVDRLVTLFFSAGWTILLLVGGVAGALLFWKEQKDLPSRAFLLFALLQPLAVVPIIVETRYRYPLFPFLAIFAAYAAYVWQAQRRIIYMVVGIFIVFTTYDLWYNWTEIVEKIRSALFLL